MKIEHIHTRFETLLDYSAGKGEHKTIFHGTSSTLAVSFALSQCNSKNINILPHLVVVPSSEDILSFKENILFFDPSLSVYTLPEFDFSPYSGLYVNQRIVAERLRFLHKAQHAKAAEVFITSPNALSQLVLPFKVLNQFTTSFRVGSLLPENFSEQLKFLGYQSVPLVEDVGQFSIRGGIIDLFSSAHDYPVRIELFGDEVHSLRKFNTIDQRSDEEINSFYLIPAKDVLYTEDSHEKFIRKFKDSCEGRKISKIDFEETLRSIVLKNYFQGDEFLLPFCYDKLETAIDHFSSSLNVWLLDPLELSRQNDLFLANLKKEYLSSADSVIIRPELESFYISFDTLCFPQDSRQIIFSNLETIEGSDVDVVPYPTHNTLDFSSISLSHPFGSESWIENAKKKISAWRDDGNRIFVAVKNQSLANRLLYILEKMEFHHSLTNENELLLSSWISEQNQNHQLIHIIPYHINESLRLDEEKIIFLRDVDFFGRKERSRGKSNREEFQSSAKHLSFGDLKAGDLVVHVKHGIGQYEGLKIMEINGVAAEFIQVAYKDKDKLYLPVYRVGQLQKYSGASSAVPLDKLGSHHWEKTKAKVKTHLKDIASELLALYAKRAELHRPAFNFYTDDIIKFENSFPYEETEDQIRAINDIKKDLGSARPMDRLICGDVGFGKTEVAMRAAFFAVENKKQVAVLAPTTVLTFQHVETFKKRFNGWPIEIRVLNRFISTADAKKTLSDLKEGKVDILIGTHRLLSKDITFKDLGLLIIDEEQKFGVAHKEKIKKLKNNVDTLTLSATPIPRTLNMSLMGIRDLSLINTPPHDRLPTRTFVCKFEEETIRKAIDTEIARGGQVYFIHNRIQSIYSLADELRTIVPQARIRVAHGQMDEDQLEKTMLEFFHHEIDLLICTAIVESGMDVPRANTMFIDSANMFGLSQLYQLRGRVGRSSSRAYCYLIMPRDKKLDKDAQERLKIIQENSALGSGIKIAQYDLELRGAGNILGEDQSGHVNLVGYELYMDLLAEALANAKGESAPEDDLDPEINLKVAALIPDSYIKDIRLRLSYYKALADIRSSEELERIEEDMRDQFGPIPEPTLNLMGLMLIRKQCKDLGVRDVSAGLKTISLIFTERTKLKPEIVINLAMRENKKYSITPDNRLNIRMNNITWSAVFEELNYLLKL